MNNHYLATTITVRMGVLFGGPAMSSPTSVANPVAAFTGILAKRFLQIAELSRRAPHLQLTTVYHGDARGVIATILQALQSIHQHRDDCFLPQISNNAAHGDYSLRRDSLL